MSAATHIAAVVSPMLIGKRCERYPISSARRQRGSMAVNMLLVLAGLVAMLGLSEIGYLYWAKRDTQKVVDLAALAGAQQLPACTTDNSSNSAALGSATSDNGFTGTLIIDCGHWDSTQPGDQHFVAVTAELPRNAVRVQATLPLVPFFGFASFSSVGATAIAVGQGPPIASFSVGSSTLTIDPASPLGSVLTQGLGSSLGLQLLSFNGIANANISLLDLVKSLPIDAGTVDSVLAAKMTLTDFLHAFSSTLAGSTSAAGIDFTAFNQLIAALPSALGNVQISLGDILNVDANTEDPNVALKTDISALDILNASVLAADSANGLVLPTAAVNLGVASVTLATSVVEPPKIGVGGVGTVAHTAQLRLALSINVLGNPITGDTLSSIPLYLEVAPTDATITAFECNVPGSGGKNSDSVTITTAPGLLNAYLGTLTPNAFNNTSQSWAAIVASGTKAPLLNVSPLGVNVATVSASSNIQLATNPATPITFSVDPTVPVSQQSNMTQIAGTSTLTLGSVVTSLLSSSTLQTSIIFLGGPPTVISVAPLLATLSSVLAPVTSVIDAALVTPLLQTLGIQIGTAQVNLRGINCDTSAQLVY